MDRPRIETVRILYTNYRGETAWRDIWPLHIHYGCTTAHPEKQWFLHAYDLGKQAERDFAIKDIYSWVPCE